MAGARSHVHKVDAGQGDGTVSGAVSTQGAAACYLPSPSQSLLPSVIGATLSALVPLSPLGHTATSIIVDCRFPPLRRAGLP